MDTLPIAVVGEAVSISAATAAVANIDTLGAVELTDALSSAAAYARADKAVLTRRAYHSDWRDFVAWCGRLALQPLPADERTVAMYLGKLADRGLSASTVSRRTAAIAYGHKLAGREPPTNAEAVKATVRGIRRTIGTAPRQKSPVTADVMAELLAQVPKTGVVALRDRALLLLGFSAALRRSELVGLDVADLQFVREGLIVHLGKTKTDQEGRGARVAVPNGSKLKPVLALKLWLEAAAIVDGAVFRRIRRGGHVTDGRLTGSSVSMIVKAYAGPAGFDLDEFAAHSLRAGFVTQALESGADPLRVMDQTRHRDPRTLKRYDRRGLFKGHAAQDFL